MELFSSSIKYQPVTKKQKTTFWEACNDAGTKKELFLILNLASTEVNTYVGDEARAIAGDVILKKIS